MLRLAAALMVATRHAVDAMPREDPKRPVSKVISLLEGMQKTLETEQKEDEDIYEKMECWCDDNEKEKTTTISDAKSHIELLSSQIESHTAKSAKLSVEIKALDAEVAANKDTLAEAASIRAKQHDEFNGEEKDMLETITALKSAILVLSKHQSSFLQRPTPSMISTAAELQEQMQRHAQKFNGVLTSSQRKALNIFFERQFVQDPTFHDAYTSQSGEIYGILQQMLEQFTADLSDAQKEELHRQENYKNLHDAKTTEIEAGESQIEAKTLERANTDEDNVRAKQDLEDTKASLSADEKYLLMLQQKCQLTETEWDERQKMRQEEMSAISQALEILSTSDAHDTFTRTFNPSFFQVAIGRHSNKREQASMLLSRTAGRLHNPELSALATQVNLDDFTDVKAAIDKIVEQLLQEKDDEIKHKDWCIEALHTNHEQTESHERERAKTQNEISTLEATIEKLDAEIESLNHSISTLEGDLAHASDERERQHKEFQIIVTDQRETQRLLQEATEALRSYYDTVSLAQLRIGDQKQEPVGPPPPKGFDTYEHQAAPSVIALMDQILSDAKKLEEAAVHAEQDAQTAYEMFAEETHASIMAKSHSIMDKEDHKAKASLDLIDANEDNTSTASALTHLSAEATDVHKDCDFFLKNFDVRQNARDEEVKALRDAKSILSGSDFS